MRMSDCIIAIVSMFTVTMASGMFEKYACLQPKDLAEKIKLSHVAVKGQCAMNCAENCRCVAFVVQRDNGSTQCAQIINTEVLHSHSMKNCSDSSYTVVMYRKVCIIKENYLDFIIIIYSHSITALCAL